MDLKYKMSGGDTLNRRLTGKDKKRNPVTIVNSHSASYVPWTDLDTGGILLVLLSNNSVM